MDIPEWYLISEIPFERYVQIINEVYQSIESSEVSYDNRKEDIFLRIIVCAKNAWTEEQWVANEHFRRHQRVIEMCMGRLHQNLIGAFNGCTDVGKGHQTGCDVITIKDDVYEIKNRKNTMNSDSQKSVIAKLKEVSNQGKRGILVLINHWGRKKAIEGIPVLTGKDIYNKLSERETFYDDLKATLHSTFSLFPTLEKWSQGISEWSKQCDTLNELALRCQSVCIEN
jgi:hypothetical protein